MRPTDKEETPTQYAANVKQWRDRELAQDKETIPAREKLAQFKLTDAQRLALLADEHDELLTICRNLFIGNINKGSHWIVDSSDMNHLRAYLGRLAK